MAEGQTHFGGSVFMCFGSWAGLSWVYELEQQTLGPHVVSAIGSMVAGFEEDVSGEEGSSRQLTLGESWLEAAWTL